VPSAFRRYLDDPIAAWRTGTNESQGLILGSLLVAVGVCFVISLANYSLMPLTAYYLWLLLGMMLLRFVPLIVLSSAAVLAALTAMVSDGPLVGPRITAIITLLLSAALILYASSRQHSGLPQPVSEAMLADLRDRLRSQGTIPDLPEGWDFESAFVSAHGGGYGGDFLVSQLSADGRQLEVILVDVAGKGVPAATRALQFGGALGGLIGALPPQGVVAAANTFLFRQDSDETFATAVHVVVDLESGEYHLINAGHPPVLVWSGQNGRWSPDEVRGTALGVVPQPDIATSTGTLEPGQALLLYTDGVVETRTADLDRGVAWLQHEAQEAVHSGFAGAARRILSSVEAEDDDRAVIVVRRRALSELEVPTVAEPEHSQL
jgi:hypothetical protein